MSLELKASVTNLPNVGGKTASLLEKLSIKTAEDLLFYFPYRYDDLSQTKQIADLIPGETTSLKVNLWQIKTIRTRTGKFLTTAILSDSTGTIEAVWFNQYYLEKTLKTHREITIAGKPTTYRGKLTFVSPIWEPVLGTEPSLHTSRLVPIYPQTAGLNSKWLRNKIKLVLDTFSDQIPETLPEEILDSEKFPRIEQALRQIHFPTSLEEAERARSRFAYEELLVLQIVNLSKKSNDDQLKVGRKFKIDATKIQEFISDLPFTPTKAQLRAIDEVVSDLKLEKSMNRLLQGDVGSGKTLVATVAAYVSSLNQGKTLFMAPTEILAQQHFHTLRSLLSHLPIRVGLVTGSQKFDPEADIILGTSALLNLNLPIDQIGLVIIDEQHRFGVEQRSKLRSKGFHPHLLTLTATPIPRTMALIFFGELDLSVLDEMPTGRKTPRTYLVTPEKRLSAYEFIRKHAKAGDQTFIICPLIDPSETLASVRSVREEWERLSKEIFPDLKLGLLHGRLSSKEKAQILASFRKGDFQVLVSTPVVEVGIDIPSATIVLIEAADRFGLASLHQLRGRVGRGDKQSFCLLFSETADSRALARLKNMEKLTSGFDLAEADLAYRGPGQVFGTLQHGLPDLKIASFSNTDLIAKTRKTAENLLRDKPKLLKNSPLSEKIEKTIISPSLD